MNLLTPEQRMIRDQRERIDELEETLRQIRDAEAEQRRVNVSHVPQMIFPREWKLTPALSRFLAAMVSAPAGFISYDNAATALISYAHDTENAKNIVATQTCRLRALLRPMGVEIKTLHGSGFELTPLSRAIVKQAMDRQGQAA